MVGIGCFLVGGVIGFFTAAFLVAGRDDEDYNQ